MKFSCENCNTRYTLSDEKVKNRILKIRCKVCEDIIVVRDPASVASVQTAARERVEVEWYTSRDGGTPEGPMPLERLEDRIKSGTLRTDDMVWNQGMASWARADETLADQFEAARKTNPLPPFMSGLRIPPPLPRAKGQPAQPKSPQPAKAHAKTPAPRPPAPSLSAPDPAQDVVETPPALAEAADSDDATVGMAADFGQLFADLKLDNPSNPAAPVALQGRDTVAVAPTSAGAVVADTDTLLAPAATASAAAAMMDNDTTLLPELGSPPGPPAPLDEPAEASPGLLSDAAPALPSSAPPAAAPAESVPPAPISPGADAPLTGAQSALVEDAFFGSESAATDSGAYAAAAGPSASYDAIDEPEERKNRLPLFIILAVLLLGGGIALGVMIAGGDPVAPATTPSTASAATEAPRSEAPPSVAMASEAPPSAPVTEAPATEAPATEAPKSVASAPKRINKPKRVKPKTPVSAKPESAASKAPATGRFAKLSGQGKAPEVKPSTIKTEAPVELPETLGQSQISGVIKRYKKGLHGCYQRQLKRDSSMRKANLKLAFSIERSGRTSNIKVGRKYTGTELGNCLNRLVRRWRFPQFTGEAIPVEYPLFFQASL